MSSIASTIIDTRTAGPASAASVLPTAAAGVVAIPHQRTASDQIADPADVQTCRCGHGADAHQHFRSGSDCSGCGCARYRSTVGRAAMLVAVLVRGRR